MKTVLHRIETHARQRPDKCAVATDGEEVGFATLWALSGGYWHLFDEASLVPGDVVGCCLPDNADRLAALIGALRAGVVFAFIDPNLPPAAARPIVHLSRAKVELGDETGACGMPNLSQRPTRQDRPRGVLCDDEALCRQWGASCRNPTCRFWTLMARRSPNSRWAKS